MAWENNLQEASFRGVVFDVTRCDDAVERATAEHAYPYRDGAGFEDLGAGARRFTLEAVFWDGLIAAGTRAQRVSGYETRLQEFIRALDQSGPGELVHPVFGSIKQAQVTRYTIRHEADAVDAATVVIDFVEAAPEQPFFDRKLAAQTAEAVGLHGEVARGRLATALADLIGRLRAANPLSMFDSLRAAMTQPLLAVSAEVQDVVLSGSDLLSSPRAFCSDVASLVDGALNICDFSTSLLSGFGMFQRTVGLFDVFGFARGSGTSSAPVFTAGVPSESQAVSAVQAQIDAQKAVGLADAAALVLAAESTTPTLSPPEIEGIVNAAREAVDAAIEAVRATYLPESSRLIVEALKDQALAVQDSARAVIETRPPLLDRASPVGGNLRLLAHAWYGDHTRAPELARLNPSLRLPNFISQGDVLHAFAR